MIHLVIGKGISMKFKDIFFEDDNRISDELYNKYVQELSDFVYNDKNVERLKKMNIPYTTTIDKLDRKYLVPSASIKLKTVPIGRIKAKQEVIGGDSDENVNVGDEVLFGNHMYSIVEIDGDNVKIRKLVEPSKFRDKIRHVANYDYKPDIDSQQMSLF